MGAETSTLASIDSLSASLLEIERKLVVIEDTHTHHERTICHDDAVIVSGKRIQCRADVHLIVGPVLGIIGQTTGRVLLETDTDADITLNFFIIDELVTDARYQCEDSFTIKAGQPIARSFKGLLPGTRYAMYIGGVNSTDTLMNYATFKTMPIDDSPVRFIFTHHGRVDRQLPGEVNLWEDIDQQVSSTGVHVGILAGQHRETPLPFHVGTLAGNNNNTTAASKSSAQVPSIALIVHNGDTVCIDSVIRRRALELMDLILRDDISLESWRDILQEIEEIAKREYRSAFTSPCLRNILKRCGNVFLAGQGEAAMATASLLAMGPRLPAEITPPPPSDEELAAMAAQAKEEQASKPRAYGKEALAQQKAEEEAAAAALAEKNRKKKRGEEIDAPLDLPEDMEVPLVGGSIRRAREAIIVTKDAKTILLEELRLLLISALERTTRRACWMYMRQLWDENYHEVAAEDLEAETLQRDILSIRKTLVVKKTLEGYLERSLKKVVREFGEEYNASTLIAGRLNEARTEIKKLEGDLRDLIRVLAVFNNKAKEAPNGACIDLGQVAVVIVETAWGWLGPDGVAQGQLFNRSIPLHSDIISSLEQKLVDDTDRLARPRRAVVVLAPFTILPTTSAESASDTRPNEPQMFSLGSVSKRQLLRMLAIWQQQDTGRAVLLVGAGDSFSAEGFAFPTAVSSFIVREGSDNNVGDENENDGDAIGTGVGSEGELASKVSFQEVKAIESKESADGANVTSWNEQRCQLKQIVVGQLDRKTKVLRGSCRGTSARSSGPDAGFIDDEGAEFSADYNVATACVRRSYWDVSLLPPVAGMMRGSEVISPRPAEFTTQCISDWKKSVAVVVGPVIGQVTATSANILLETSEDGYLELICRDQLTGVEYSCACNMRSMRPSIFTFDNLVPNRPYEVTLAEPPSAHALIDPRDISTASPELLFKTVPPSVRGSFTTLRHSDLTVEESSDKQAAQQLREQAHNLPVGFLQGPAAVPPPGLSAAGRVNTGMGAESSPGSLKRQVSGGGGNSSLARQSSGQHLNNAANVVAGSGGGGGGGGGQPVTPGIMNPSNPALPASMSLSAPPPTPLRLLTIGSLKPTWLRHLPEEDDEERDYSNLGSDRTYFLEGLVLCRAVASLASHPWCGVSAVVHCGYSADMTATLDMAISKLAKAEEVRC